MRQPHQLAVRLFLLDYLLFLACLFFRLLFIAKLFAIFTGGHPVFFPEQVIKMGTV